LTLVESPTLHIETITVIRYVAPLREGFKHDPALLVKSLAVLALVFSVLFVLINITVDVLYAFVDPRIRYD
jgi:ABC-type microcin C transport system permease subunit YejB